MGKEKLHITWAFDPYSENNKLWDRTVDVLNNLVGRNANAEVCPTYFLGSGLVHWISNMTPSRVEPLLPKVSELVKKRMVESKIKGQVEPVLKVTGCLSKREDANFAVNYFNKTQTDLIVVNTNAGTGVKRMFMGSFSEDLLLSSKKPIMFVSPHTDKIEDFDKVFYPTSLSDKEYEGFCEFLDNNMGLGKKIYLYSKIETPINAFAQTASSMFGGGWVSITKFVDEECEEKKKTSEKWLTKAKEKGFDIVVDIDDRPGIMVDDILGKIKESAAGLVVMTSYVGAMDAVLIGSTSREVIRNSVVPVLVRHYFEK